MMKKHH